MTNASACYPGGGSQCTQAKGESLALPRAFIRESNFELAFQRLFRGSNKDFKRYYRHLFAGYSLGIGDVASDLSRRISRGEYEPAAPTLVFQPKTSGILRPLALLTFADLLVYQAIGNFVGDAFHQELSQTQYKRSFGPIYAGSDRQFFFRSWKRAYDAYNRAIRTYYDAGYNWIADFDLVSCYELIDHNLLQQQLARAIKNEEFLAFVGRCLSAWTTNWSGQHLRHGVPQGPEASALLADLVLSQFDRLPLKDVQYVRYVDDVKIMAKSEAPLRRALLRLDLTSKDLGLVPQAQKITLRQVRSLDEVVKTIPSALAAVDSVGRDIPKGDLVQMFRGSQKKYRGRWEITDVTRFKFALTRLGPRRDVLRRIGAMLSTRPDLAYYFSLYLRKFPEDREAADLLLSALRKDPTYDSAAAAYIEALDSCEPPSNNTQYRRIIQTATRRSEEGSITLELAALTFRCKRAGPRDALRTIKQAKHPLVRGIAISRLFEEPNAPYKISEALPLLHSFAISEDADLAVFSINLLVREAVLAGSLWRPPATVNHTGGLLLTGLGLRQRKPRRRGILTEFFRKRALTALPWRRALGKDFREAERRCLRLQGYLLGDPTARILILDTFNELLLQSFSASHPVLAALYRSAAGKNLHPDYGNWIRNGAFVAQLPRASPWLQKVHDSRVHADLAHAKSKSGKHAGKPTRSISYPRAATLMNGFASAWSEILPEWYRVL
jgi:retron-type reverse transcriptase